MFYPKPETYDDPPISAEDGTWLTPAKVGFAVEHARVSFTVEHARVSFTVEHARVSFAVKHASPEQRAPRAPGPPSGSGG